MRSIPTGMALGGGVARSFANIGVLNVLLREGIRLDYLAGSSAASIIGAIYASGASIAETNRIALQTRWSDLLALSWHAPWRGLFSTHQIGQFLRKHCRCYQFEELPRRFGVIAADLMSGEERLFTTGDLLLPVCASCCIPGVFQPVRIGKRLYIDGCFVNQIPAAALRRMGAKLVIGCDVSRGALAVNKNVPRNVLTMLRHLVALHSQRTANKGRAESDVLIVVKVDDIKLTDLHRAAEIIRRGEMATELMLPAIRTLLANAPNNHSKSC